MVETRQWFSDIQACQMEEMFLARMTSSVNSQQLYQAGSWTFVSWPRCSLDAEGDEESLASAIKNDLLAWSRTRPLQTWPPGSAEDKDL